MSFAPRRIVVVLVLAVLLYATAPVLLTPFHVRVLDGAVADRTTPTGSTANNSVITSTFAGSASLNHRLTVHPADLASPAQRYCDDPNDCWEPQDLAGNWVLDVIRNGSSSADGDGTTVTVKETRNLCNGWNFGKFCENGYAINVECPGFVDQYTWKADGLSPFNATESCLLLGNRTVLLLGDSTMGQSASSLINRLVPGGCQHQIHFELSDTLIKKYLGPETMQNAEQGQIQQHQQDHHLQRRLAMNRGQHWTISVEKQKPDIVVFSLGAHIYGEDRWKAAFDEVLDGMILHKTKRDIHFVYKTISPGGCSKEIATAPPDEAARTFPHYQYNWDVFYGRDLYALERLRRQLQWPVLDMRMLYARTDSHVSSRETKKKDCLHWCTPGPLDVVADLFQELLMHELQG